MPMLNTFFYFTFRCHIGRSTKMFSFPDRININGYGHRDEQTMRSIWERLYGNSRGMEGIISGDGEEVGAAIHGIPREPPDPLKSTSSIYGSPSEWDPDHGVIKFQEIIATQIHSLTTPLNPIAANFISPTIARAPGNETFSGWNDNLGSNITECGNERVTRASHWTYLYGIGFLLLMAFLLNALALMIFRTKPLKNYAFSIYISVLSVIDTASLISHLPRRWLQDLYMVLGWETSDTFYDSNMYACKSITFLAYVSRFMSAWLVVALISERLTLTSHPYNYKRLRTLRNAKQAVLYIGVSAILLNLYTLVVWQSTTLPGTGEGPVRYACIPVSTSTLVSTVLPVATIVSIVGLPFVLISVLTSATIHNFPAWRVRPRKMSSNAICRALLEKQATVMVSALSGIYAILCAPYAIAVTLDLLQLFIINLSHCQSQTLSATRDITEVIFTINYAIKFLVCIFAGRNVLNQR